MDGVDRVENHGRGAGAGEGGGDFMADMARFADPGNDDLTSFFDTFEEKADRPGEGAIEAGAEVLEAFDLEIENPLRALDIVHGTDQIGPRPLRQWHSRSRAGASNRLTPGPSAAMLLALLIVSS
jgi:hypothetical protein